MSKGGLSSQSGQKVLLKLCCRKHLCVVSFRTWYALNYWRSTFSHQNSCYAWHEALLLFFRKYL